MSNKNNDLDKHLVGSIVESTLFQAGNPIWEIVDLKLKERGLTFENCLEHPSYLKDILQQNFGSSYREIAKKIMDRFDGLYTNEPINAFIKTLSE